MTEHRLGLLPAQQDARSFKLERFLDVPQVKIPLTNERTLGKGTAWGMLGNDRYGDCAFAGKAHAEMAWHHASHNPVTTCSGDFALSIASTADSNSMALNVMDFMVVSGVG